MRLSDRLNLLVDGRKRPGARPKQGAPSLTERLAPLANVPAPDTRATEQAMRKLAERLAPLGEISEPTPINDPGPGPQTPSLYARLTEMAKGLPSIQPGWFPVPFAPWMPDLPDLHNPGATVANNVYPAFNSYRPVKALSPATDALDARVRGMIAARDSSGNNYNYAGDASKLYEVRASAVTDKSKGGGYSTAATDVWEAILFGDQVIFTNYTDDVQGLTAGGAGNFADHITSTNVPKAKHIGIVGNFTVLGYTNDTTDGVKPNRVWWSGINDSQDFDPDATTQCDYQDVAEGGQIQRIVGVFTYGVIFQRSMIRRMVYDGAPLIFRFNDIIDASRGTPVPGSVASFGRLIVFYADDGFFVTDGLASHPIGVNQVDDTFASLFDVSNAHLVSSAVDPVNKLYAIAFPAGAASTANKIYFYDLINRRWSEADVTLDMIGRGVSEAYTLEELDAIFLDSTADTTLSANEAGGQTVISVTDETGFATGDTVRITLNDTTVHQTTIASVAAGEITIDDALPSAADSGNRFVKTSIDSTGLSLDSPQFKGGSLRLAAYDSNQKLAYFEGDTLEATLETQEEQIFPGHLAKVDKLRPLVDGDAADITAAIAGRNRLQDSYSYGTAGAVDTIGEVGVDDEARYHRARVTIAAAGSWTEAQGVEVRAVKTGEQ